ncbi:MAG: FMN-dependent NADH-azoreductase [Marinibacterium sp.]
MSHHTILHVDASARREGSLTRDVGAYLADQLGGADIVHRDLTETLPHVSETWMRANFTSPSDRSDDMRAALALSDSLIAELRAADILVLGIPIYNFSVPAAMKAWIDMVCRAGETFAYSEEGPKGLLTGKKAYLVMASGGTPIGSEIDFATPYMRQFLTFVGIEDVTLIAGERTAFDAAAAHAAAMNSVKQALAAA